MRSPFPGMDPYIEACGLWADFHDQLITEAGAALNQSLPERYVARVAARSYVELISPEGEAVRQSLVPDVSVRSKFDDPAREARAVAVAEDPAAVIMHGLVEIDHRELYLEIRELDPQRRLVTSIEILSPANKRRGGTGWVQYQKKRQAFLAGYAHLVEVDLLRGGQRMPMEEPWPENSPYYALVLRKERAPECTVRPLSLRAPLPAIPVPLSPPDEDVVLAIQPLVEAIYTRSRYAQDIDYRTPLQPALASEDTVWLEERLRERGVRA